jgi:hypothetical protein
MGNIFTGVRRLRPREGGRLTAAKAIGCVTVAVAVGAITVAAALTGTAKADVATWDSSGCSHKEDPANMQFNDMGVKIVKNGTVTSTEQGAKATKHVADNDWQSVAAASSDSWYFFSSQPNNCIDNTYWSANHAPFNDGSHARFWTDPATWTNVRSGSHHDHYCGGTSDTVDHYNSPRDNLAAFFANFAGLEGSYWYSYTETPGNTAKNWSKPCGFTVSDDGFIAHVQQNTTWVDVGP